MDKDAELLYVQFICEKCNKPIRGCKNIRIKGKRYHMTCGMAQFFPKREKSASVQERIAIQFGEKMRVKE